LAKDEITTESGRVFRPAHKELLENLPPDMVKELACRRMKDIERIKGTINSEQVTGNN
jgi:hypothetical protein